MDTTGTDQTEALTQGAGALLAHAQAEQIELCVMLDVSDSCGSNVIYDGLQTPTRYREGVGVAVAVLLRAGFPVISHRDFATLGWIRTQLDPTFVVPDDAIDFTEHPWFLESFRND